MNNKPNYKLTLKDMRNGIHTTLTKYEVDSPSRREQDNAFKYLDILLEKANKVEELEKENKQLKEDAKLGKALKLASDEGYYFVYSSIMRYGNLLRIDNDDLERLLDWYEQQIEKGGK